MSKDKSKEKKDKKLSSSSKMSSKHILKSSKVTINIPEPKEPEKVRSSYFNKTYEQEKRRLFFK